MVTRQQEQDLLVLAGQEALDEEQRQDRPQRQAPAPAPPPARMARSSPHVAEFALRRREQQALVRWSQARSCDMGVDHSCVCTLS